MYLTHREKEGARAHASGRNFVSGHEATKALADDIMQIMFWVMLVHGSVVASGEKVAKSCYQFCE